MFCKTNCAKAEQGGCSSATEASAAEAFAEACGAASASTAKSETGDSARCWHMAVWAGARGQGFCTEMGLGLADGEAEVGGFVTAMARIDYDSL